MDCGKGSNLYLYKDAFVEIKVAFCKIKIEKVFVFI